MPKHTLNCSSKPLSRRRLIQAAASLPAASALPLWAQSGDILIGQTAALTGSLSTPNIEVNRGVDAAFKEFNAKGGLGGKKLKFVSLDDAYDVEKAKRNLKELVEVREVVALLCIGGTPANAALGPLIAEAKVPHVGPITGADQLRTPVNPYVFNTRASYGAEVVRLIEQLSTLGQRKVLALQSDNAFGKGAGAAFAQLAKAKGLEVIPVVMGDGAGEAEKASAAMVAAQANAMVSFFGSASNNGFDAVKQLREQVPGIPLYTISVLGSPMTVKNLGASATNMTVSQVVPFPYRSTANALVNNYQAAMRKFSDGNFSHNSIEGYINASVLIRALQRAGSPASRVKLFQALESAPISLEGYEVDFTKGNRNGSRFTDLVIVSSRGTFLR